MRARGLLALAAGLALYIGLAVDSMRQTSATFDEPAHLSAAWTHLALQDYRLSPDHPPLVQSLAAVPLLFMGVRMDASDEAWTGHAIWRFARHWLYVWNDAGRLLFWGRFAIVIVGAALVAALFLWTRARFGPAPALVALFLAVLSPDLLAHGQVVTTDMGAAATMFLAVVAFDAALRRTTPARVLVAGLALGAALATKLSALGLGPILLALALARLVDPRPLVGGFGAESSVAGRAARAAVLAGVLIALIPVAVAVIWAAYGFQRGFGADPGLAATFPWESLRASHPLVQGSVQAARDLGLLPDPYLFGFLRFFQHSEARRAFLLGHVSATGFPQFFLVSFLVKTPLPLLALLLLAAAGRGRDAARTGALAAAWVPFLVYAALTQTRGLNIGHRHLLPLYPFAFVLAGAAGAWLPRRLGRAGALALAALLGWYAWGTLHVHPHELAYFNETVGGPANGWRVLVDSSLDWGQDLARVEPWMRRHGIRQYKLSYFGSASPRYHGITGEMLPGYSSPRVPRVTREVSPGDILAVSATNLQGIYIEDEDQPLMARIRQLSPIGRIGYSILVFRADFRWPGPDDSRGRSGADWTAMSKTRNQTISRERATKPD
jgi:4-amino-4-deoxy-L-arabinose transferase-like glycosyltransferase